MNKSGVKAISPEAMEFAPGLLAIQESPPAKLPRTIMYSVLALFVILLAWALFGKLDVVASAEGRLVPQTYVKIVQPAEGGVVQDILVREGQAVAAGQVLLRMDAKVAETDAKTVLGDMNLAMLQLRRIDAELAGEPMHVKAGDPPSVYAQIDSQYRAHRQAYLDALAQETAALQKAKHELVSAQEILHKLRQVVPTYQKTAAAYEKLAVDGFVGSLAAQDKQRDRIEKEQDLLAQESTVASLKATVLQSERRRAQITSNYLSQLQNERIETEGKQQRLSGESAKLEHKANLLELRAPQAGIIKDLATHTRGAVVSPGSVLMTLVPHNEVLLAEVMVKNEDVGFVHVDQHVKVKLAAYPFQKYGMVDGTVVHVGADAMDGAPPQQQKGNEQQNLPGLLSYKALIWLDKQQLEVDGNPLRLSPGMQVVAEIHQGPRTVMEYLLSPVRKAWHEAGRER